MSGYWATYCTKYSSDLNLGQGLCICTSFHFPDSGLYLLNGFDYYFDLFWMAWHWKPGKHLSNLTTHTLETTILSLSVYKNIMDYFWPRKVTRFNWWRWRSPWRNEDQRAVIERDNLNLSEFVSRPVVAIGQRCYLPWNRKARSTGGKTVVVFSCSFVPLLIYHH